MERPEQEVLGEAAELVRRELMREGHGAAPAGPDAPGLRRAYRLLTELRDARGSPEIDPPGSGKRRTDGPPEAGRDPPGPGTGRIVGYVRPEDLVKVAMQRGEVRICTIDQGP